MYRFEDRHFVQPEDSFMYLAHDITYYHYSNRCDGVDPKIDYHAPEKESLKFFDIHGLLLSYQPNYSTASYRDDIPDGTYELWL